MSWLKEVEDILAKQKAEHEAQAKAEQLAKGAEERERKRKWETYESQVVKKLLAKWEELEINRILKDVRNVVWPESEIGKLKIILPIKTKRELYVFDQLTLHEETREVKDSSFFARPPKAEIVWYGDVGGNRWKSSNITEVMVKLGIESSYDPSDIQNPYIERSIFHYRNYYAPPSWTCDMGEWRTEEVSDITLRFYENHVAFEDYNVPLDKIDNAEALKEKITQNLKERFQGA